MTLLFAAQPSDRNADLLGDLQQEVSSGKLGDFSVDESHVLNVEPDVGETFVYVCFGNRIRGRGDPGRPVRRWGRGLWWGAQVGGVSSHSGLVIIL